MASAPTKSVVLGLDCSTQSLKATAVVVVQSPPSVRVVYRREVRYDRDLPRFGTTDGMHVRPDPRQDGVHTVTAPPAMVRGRRGFTCTTDGANSPRCALPCCSGWLRWICFCRACTQTGSSLDPYVVFTVLHLASPYDHMM